MNAREVKAVVLAIKINKDTNEKTSCCVFGEEKGHEWQNGVKLRMAKFVGLFLKLKFDDNRLKFWS